MNVHIDRAQPGHAAALCAIERKALQLFRGHPAWPAYAAVSMPVELLRQGIGWGNMPLPMVEPDLIDGTLVRLAMPEAPGGAYRFCGIYRRDVPPGPAAAWLLERFVAAGAEAGPGLADI